MDSVPKMPVILQLDQHVQEWKNFHATLNLIKKTAQQSIQFIFTRGIHRDRWSTLSYRSHKTFVWQ